MIMIRDNGRTLLYTEEEAIRNIAEMHIDLCLNALSDNGIELPSLGEFVGIIRDMIRGRMLDFPVPGGSCYVSTPEVLKEMPPSTIDCIATRVYRANVRL